MKIEKKQRFTRAEAVAAMAAAYREEQRKLHELTRTAQNAAQRGEAAECPRRRSGGSPAGAAERHDEDGVRAGH